MDNLGNLQETFFSFDSQSPSQDSAPWGTEPSEKTAYNTDVMDACGC